MAFVNVTGLNKYYQSTSKRLHVLRDLDLSVEKGEMVAIMGASGVGKSTLLHVMGTLEEPSSGRLVIAGDDVSRLRDRDLARFRSRHLGFVFQQFNLFPHLNVLDNVTLAPRKVLGIDRSGAESNARELLDRFGISARHIVEMVRSVTTAA